MFAIAWFVSWDNISIAFGLIGLKTLIIFVMRFVWSFLQDVMFKLVEQHPRDSAEGMDMIKVVYGDESIPSLYENSQVSQEQLPGQPGGYGSFIHFLSHSNQAQRA